MCLTHTLLRRSDSMKKYLLRLPEENFEYISKKAEKENLSVNEYINKIIENDISVQKFTSAKMKNLLSEK